MRDGSTSTITTAEKRAIDRTMAELRTGFEGSANELIPMLQVVQRALGYLPEEALERIGEMTGVPSAAVFGVATFYSQFRLQPVGRHVIKVCTGTACHVRGSAKIQKDLQQSLEIEPGQTTEDREFTLETVSCFGSCALAPVMVTDESVHGRMNTMKARTLVEGLTSAEDAGEEVALTEGER
jgi:NADH-quinone oxidoreductase subunit E